MVRVKTRNRYTEEFKENTVRRILSGQSVTELSAELGINRNQLFRWKKNLGHTSTAMTKPEREAKRPQDWTLEEKLDAVVQSMRLSDEELGAFLRNRGLHKADLDEWRASVFKGARAELAGQRPGQEPRAQTHPRARARAGTQGQGARRGLGAAGAEKKSGGDLGGRGRRHGAEQRTVTLQLLADAVAAGARLEPACELLGLTVRTVQRWRADHGGDDMRRGPASVPHNKLNPQEEKRLIKLVNLPRYRELSPKQIIPMLATRGIYIASEATLYRILKKYGQQHHRSRARPPSRRPRAPHGPWALPGLLLGHHLPAVLRARQVLLSLPRRRCLESPHHGRRRPRV
jgi:putative transposase